MECYYSGQLTLSIYSTNPHVSEAHYEYTSFPEYVITIMFYLNVAYKIDLLEKNTKIVNVLP